MGQLWPPRIGQLDSVAEALIIFWDVQCKQFGLLATKATLAFYMYGRAHLMGIMKNTISPCVEATIACNLDS